MSSASLRIACLFWAKREKRGASVCTLQNWEKGWGLVMMMTQGWPLLPALPPPARCVWEKERTNKQTTTWPEASIEKIHVYPQIVHHPWALQASLLSLFRAWGTGRLSLVCLSPSSLSHFILFAWGERRAATNWLQSSESTLILILCGSPLTQRRHGNPYPLLPYWLSTYTPLLI